MVDFWLQMKMKRRKTQTAQVRLAVAALHPELVALVAAHKVVNHVYAQVLHVAAHRMNHIRMKAHSCVNARMDISCEMMDRAISVLTTQQTVLDVHSMIEVEFLVWNVREMI